MRGFNKWIGLGLGLLFTDGSFFGGLMGFLFGAFIDNFARASQYINNNQQGGRQFRSSHDIFNFYQQQTQRYDFQTMLLALSAVIMKADNRVIKSELNYVKAFFTQQFGNSFTNQHLQRLKTFLDQPNTIPLQQICNDVRMRTTPEVRVQLLHFLFGVAKVDGTVSPAETHTLQKIAQMMGIPNMDFTSVSSMFQKDTDSDYKILGVTKDATNEEIKKAYRKMALRYHPDKVAQMGEEYQKGAKEKFQNINEAYENIKKARKFN